MGKRAQSGFTAIRSEGALLPPDLLKRIAAADKDLDGLAPESFHLDKSQRISEAINRAWIACRDAWKLFSAQRSQTREVDSDTGTTVTRERWLLKLFEALGYGRLRAHRSIEIDQTAYPVSHVWGHIPLHLISYKYRLDAAEKGVFRSSPHSLMQELLNRSDDHLWAFLSNGLQLRILRDNISFTRTAFVEFDLEAIMEGEVYSDFVLLWLVCHESRVESEKPEQCWLEKWHDAAKKQGTRALDTLRAGVQQAIEQLGQGFLAHTANQALREKLRSGQLDKQDYYHQLLRLVYRFIFVFVAEDRDYRPEGEQRAARPLLLSPDADDGACRRYVDYYALGRLRRLADERRGTRHGDLWRATRLVLGMLYKGEPGLGLPALGSWLFSDSATPDLGNCEMRNDHLLSAVRSLCFTQDRGARRPVDYRNLGSEELGSVYESLLELRPDVNTDAAVFTLSAVAGSERKTTGSYYTPGSLINCLLDSALDPVVADRLRGKSGPEAERALLSLKICDPACGSGHFLIAAANRVAKRLAAVRTGDVEPSPTDQRAAFRDVVGHCVYGVDINPMAVELCKVSLWIEALEPGKPLSFLDHHIQCGNSLLGVTPALLAQGIPDDAFKPIEGDDKAVCKELKKRNKEERTGKGGFFFDLRGEARDGVRPWERLGNLATAMVALDSVADDTLVGVQDKQRRWQELVQSSGYLSGRLLADAWCAAFVWKKTREMGDAITESVFRRIERNPHDLTPWMRDEIGRLAEQYKFFHWQLGYPDVFRVPTRSESADNEHAGWSGGFNVVLGNPPWERIQVKDSEWFAERRPEILAATTAARRRERIDALRTSTDAADRQMYADFFADRRAADGQRHLIGNAGAFPLCGSGEINTFAVFAELNRALAAGKGAVGCILPTGIITKDSYSNFFRAVTDGSELVSAFDFENTRLLFPHVKPTTKFVLFTLACSGGLSVDPEFIFFAQDVTDLADTERRFRLSVRAIHRMNPNTHTCPVFRRRTDALLAENIYVRKPVLETLGEGGENPWRVRLTTLYHMSGDSKHFNTFDDLNSRGFRLDHNTLVNGSNQFVPLYEQNLINSYDHRFASFAGPAGEISGSESSYVGDPDHVDPELLPIPRYWIPAAELVKTWNAKAVPRSWVIGFRKSAANVDSRTGIFCLLPYVGAGDSIHIAFVDDGSARHTCARLAEWNSFAWDYLFRQSMDGENTSFYFVRQVATVPPAELERSPWCGRATVLRWMSGRVAELSYTARDLELFARDIGYHGPPFVWNEERRFLIRCELDAMMCHLYLGVPREWQQTGTPELLRYFATPRDAVEYIMETFPIVKRKDEAKYGSYRTKETILSIYDEMAEAIAANEAAVAADKQPTAAYRTRLDPPPGPPADEQGNFLPLPEWLPGQLRPANWPRHIHAPRDVHEWAVANGIDWRTLLEPLGAKAHASARPQRKPAAAARVAAPVLPGFETVAAEVEAPEGRREREKEFVTQAFEAVRDGRSHDFVVADPELNAAFLERARRLGAESEDAVLNSTLLNLRKAAKQKAEKTTKPYRLPTVVQPFVFVSEWAVRHLQRQLLVEANREPALDEILCNPAYAARFDEVARRLCDRFSPLEYRWAALGLRKQSRQSPDDAALDLRMGDQLLLAGFDPSRLPELPGLYLIQAPGRSLYVHESDNLRDQLTRHIETAGEMLVPDWLLHNDTMPAQLAYTVLSDADRLKEARIRKVAELQPWLNLIDLPGAA